MIVSTKLSRASKKTRISGQSNDSMWDIAIRDADEEIRSLSQQLGRLRQAVRIFKENKRDKMPWPIKQGASSVQEGLSDKQA
jgi:hypothetical protein